MFPSKIKTRDLPIRG